MDQGVWNSTSYQNTFEPFQRPISRTSNLEFVLNKQTESNFSIAAPHLLVCLYVRHKSSLYSAYQDTVGRQAPSSLDHHTKYPFHRVLDQ